jgi:quercetin dioxygenase-like cupin family protein
MMQATTRATPLHQAVNAFVPPIAADTLPWVPLGPGKSFKPLRFLAADRGFVELLRLEPGQAIARHRHTGEVHAFNLQGWRELDTGERIGPGDYVYEPEGNVDSWKVVGDETLIVLVVVMGAVEYLDPAGNVSQRYMASTLEDIYRRHCAASGIVADDRLHEGR